MRLNAAARAARRRDRELIAAARGLERHGLVVGTVGNVSMRDGARVRITPTQLAYDELAPRDLVTVDLAGRRWEGRRHPSRELAMHLAVYRARPDVQAIVHAHGTHAAAWSFLGVALEPPIEETAYYRIGPVAVSRPAPAGSGELGRAAARALGRSSAALLGGHGLVAVGDDPARALLVARVVEHHAQVAWLLRGERRSGREGRDGRDAHGPADRERGDRDQGDHRNGTLNGRVPRESTGVSDILGH